MGCLIKDKITPEGLTFQTPGTFAHVMGVMWALPPQHFAEAYLVQLEEIVKDHALFYSARPEGFFATPVAPGLVPLDGTGNKIFQ
jgi:hypothetical protein